MPKVKIKRFPATKPRRIANPPIRKNQHIRRYIGGPLDGREDIVPNTPKKKCRQYVNKSEWPDASRGPCVNHFYVLAEPVHIPLPGEVLIYEYKPDFKSSPGYEEPLLIPCVVMSHPGIYHPK